MAATGSRAQDNPCREAGATIDTNTSMCSRPIRRGEVAPYDGQLLTTALAVDLSRQIHLLEDRLTLRNDTFTALTEETSRHHEEQLRILRETSEATNRDLLSRVARAENHFDPVLAAAIGFCVGVAITVALAIVALTAG